MATRNFKDRVTRREDLTPYADAHDIRKGHVIERDLLITHLETQLATAQRELEVANNVKSESEGKLQEADSQREAIKQAKIQVEGKLRETDQKLTAANTEKGELEQRLKTKTTELETAQREKGEVEGKLATADSKNESLTADNHELNESLSEVRDQLEEAKEELNLAEQGNGNLAEQLQSMTQEYWMQRGVVRYLKEANPVVLNQPEDGSYISMSGFLSRTPAPEEITDGRSASSSADSDATTTDNTASETSNGSSDAPPKAPTSETRDKVKVAAKY